MNSILVIESDEAARGAMCELLQLEWPHLVVYAADSGELGLKLARQEQPDLILIECDLPGISGYQTARALRQTPETQLIPLIAITSSKYDESQLATSLCSTCNAWLIKPFSAQRLIQIIRPFTRHLSQIEQSYHYNSYLHQPGNP